MSRRAWEMLLTAGALVGAYVLGRVLDDVFQVQVQWSSVLPTIAIACGVVWWKERLRRPRL